MKTLRSIIKFYVDLWHDAQVSAQRRRRLEEDGLERLERLEKRIGELNDKRY